MSQDIDECCEGNRKAMQELADMRKRIEELEEILAKVSNCFDDVPVEYWAPGVERLVLLALKDK